MPIVVPSGISRPEPEQSAGPSGRAPSSWSNQLWSVIAEPYAAVAAHPFVTGIADGTLSEAVFTHYLAQDARYLRDYARVLALLAGRAARLEDTALLARHAVGTVEVELALHADLLGDAGLDTAALEAVPSSPTTYAYSRHLLSAVQQGSFADGVAAVLPCYWIYARVGEALVASGSPSPRYQRWIDTYSGEAFAMDVQEMLELVDRVGAGLGPEQRATAEREAGVSARYEWMFFDAALRLERWPL